MKDRAGFGEGATREQLAAARRRMFGWGAATALLLAATVYAGTQFFVSVADYKQLKGSLTIEVDRGSDGTFEERRVIEDSRRAAYIKQPTRVAIAKYLIDQLGPSPAYALIVNAGENWLVDSWQNLVEPETMIYHGTGTGSVAAAEGDVSLGTELTTQLNPDSVRASCTVVGEGASANIRRCQATITVDATVTLAEWGLFNQAATGGGTMFSRVVLSPTIGLNSGDSVQFTWDMTVE